MSPSRPEFRPDIEGLRGAAILLVVLFHADAGGFAGGFVGVDVFFVLSGFFITGLLARELRTTGEVRLTEFYGRRALRLMPPLFVVLLATLGLVMWLYAPIDRAPVAEHARAVALYAANIEFARGSVNYFSSGENPFLHTWSLAVEEQFYLLWPLLFLLVALRGARPVSAEGDTGAISMRPFLAAFAIAAALSFAGSLWLTNVSQPWAFFGTPTRIWEFALGGMLALRVGSGSGRMSIAAAGLTQVAGALAIVFAVAAYDKGTPYPGAAALLPVLGTVAILLGGHHAPAATVSRALSVRPLRWLGRMSYAWYLWHWPLIGLGAVLAPDIGVPGRLAWAALALVLAWLTHRLVELPAREGRLSRVPTQWLAPMALAASVAAALLAFGAQRAAERRVAAPDQRSFAAAREDRMTHDCWATTVDEPKGPCEFGDTRSSTVLVLLGDSHAEHWLGALDRTGRERGWKIVAMVKGGCPVADAPELTDGPRRRYYEQCARYREGMLRRIIAMRPAAVILSSWDHYMTLDGSAAGWQLSPDAWSRGLRRSYQRLSAAGLPVVALRGTPRTWFDVPACLSRRAANLPFAANCSYDRARALPQVAVAAQDRAARGLPVRFVDMNDQICATARCGVVRNGVVVFTDDNHLTASFSRSVAPVLGARIAAAVSPAGARLP